MCGMHCRRATFPTIQPVRGARTPPTSCLAAMDRTGGANHCEAAEKRLMILAGDIGGTNARLALFENSSGGLTMATHTGCRAHEFPSLQEIVRVFLAANPASIDAACLGVA